MSIGERAEVLAAMLQCSRPSAQSLAQAMHPRNFVNKETLAHQGTTHHHLWLILEGTIRLQTISTEGQSTVISSAGPGEFVGVYPDEREAVFDATALGSVSTLQIDARKLRQLLDQHQDLGAGLAEIFAGQLEKVLDRLSARVSLTAIGRFYRELLRLAGDQSVISPPPIVAALALSAQTTRETGSRALSALVRRGVVERHENRLEIVSKRLLEDLVV